MIALVAALIVGVVLRRPGRLPQRGLVGCRQETVDRIDCRHCVTAAFLGVESPRSALVGEIARREMRGVIPVARRHPVVGALLLTRRPERALRIRLVLGGGDDRVGGIEVGLREAVQGQGLLLRGRRVVAPRPVDHARVVADVLADRERRVLVHRSLRRGQARVRLPEVAALVTPVDHQAGLVHLLVEIGRHLVALGADPVHTHALHQEDLRRGVEGRVVQEQVLRPAAAAEDEAATVDREDSNAVGRHARRTDQ